VLSKGYKLCHPLLKRSLFLGQEGGEIVQIADETVVEVSDEDIVALNTALDDLLVAIDRVATEMRTTIETLSKPAGKS
jgi:hypothetical protein